MFWYYSFRYGCAAKTEISSHNSMLYEIRRLLTASCYLTMLFLQLDSDVQSRLKSDQFRYYEIIGDGQFNLWNQLYYALSDTVCVF